MWPTTEGLLRLFLLVQLCLAAGGAHPNDNKNDAQWVTSALQLSAGGIVQVQDSYPGVSGVDFDFLNFTARGSNVDATLQADEPSHGSQETEASVWWKWTCPFNATMLLSTEGSNFDTAVAIYILVPWNGVSVTNEFGVRRVGQGDDVLWNNVLYSQARFDAFDGQTYYIAVGGFRGATGSISLRAIIESIIIFPPPIAADGLLLVRTLDPEFILDRLGELRNPSQVLHDKFVKISITSPTPSASVFYTTDGSMPVVKETITQGLQPLGSTQRYTAPLSFDSFTVRAIAYSPSLAPSAIVTSQSFQLQATAPVFFPDGGDFDVEVSVSIVATTDEDNAAVSVIRFSLDGSDPTRSSQLYSVPLLLTNRSGLVVRARVFTPGMVPSNVSDSQPFTVRDPVDRPTIVFVGQREPGEPASVLVSPVHAVITTNTSGASIQYALGLSFGARGAWTAYTGPVPLAVGTIGIYAFASKAGRADSEVESGSLTVLSPIIELRSNVPVLGTMQEGEYAYYSLVLDDPQSDVRIAVTRLVGITDIFFSTATRRPSLRSTGLKTTLSSVAANGGGRELTALHVTPGLGLSNGTVYMSVRGSGRGLARFILRAVAETTTVIRLNQFYHDTVAIGSWRYLRFYLGTEEQRPQRLVYVTLWQSPADSVGVRIALRKGRPPVLSVLSSIPYTIFGTAQGVFKLQRDLGPADDDAWFLGIQGLVPIQGVSEVNFTLIIRTTPDDTPPETPIEREPLFQAELEADARQITAGVTEESELVAGMWDVFTIEVNEAYRTLEVEVLEDEFFGFTGALRLYVQQAIPPSLTSYLSEDVVTMELNAGQEGYWLSVPVTPGHTYYIGVHAWMYMQREYLYSITATFTARDPTLAPAPIFPLTNNFRYFYSVAQATTYSYYSVVAPNTGEDLHFVFRISAGDADVFVSSSNPYPGRDLVGVHWYSQHAAGDITDVVVKSQDPGYLRNGGVYYLSVYAITNLDFGVAAYMDRTAQLLVLGNSYGVLATTYSYRYFAVDVPVMYESFRIRTEEGAGNDFATLIVQRGRKPSQIDNVFEGHPADADGVIEYSARNIRPGRYYIMVHFFKPGYSGPVLQHPYTLRTLVDTDPPPGYKSQEGATEFQVSSVNRWKVEGLDRPASSDTDRPYAELLVPTIRVGERYPAEFKATAWARARFYMDSFVAVLTVRARAITPGLNIQLYVRRSSEPTLISYLNVSMTPDSEGVHQVLVERPVAGAFYYVGVYAPVRSLTDARVWIEASTTPRGEFEAPVTRLISYFTQFDTLGALSYKFYSIEMPADQRDITVSVTKFAGLTDIVISNIDQFPTKGRMAAAGSPPGYWKTEAAIGGGDSIVVRNFDEGYLSPATYFIAVLAVTTTDYFILVRLDRPAPTVRVGTGFYGSVAPTALSTFRFRSTIITPRLVFIVQMQDPNTEGLSLYYKEEGVPTLLDFTGRTSVFSRPGQIELDITSPKPSVLYYVGVFGVDLNLLQLGESYEFRAIVITDHAYKSFEPTPYPLPVVVPIGAYVPPAPDTYTALPPDVEVNATVSNAAGWTMFRLQVWEPTTITAVLRLSVPPCPVNVALNASNTTNATNATEPECVPGLPHGIGLFANEFRLPSDSEALAIGQPGYTGCALNSSGTGCASEFMRVELSLDPSEVVNNNGFVFLGVYGSGCNEASCLEDLPFSIIAVRTARIISSGVLRQGETQLALALPWDDSRYFRMDTNGTNVFWLFVEVTNGLADVVVSSQSKFPMRSEAVEPLKTWRSDAAIGNPTIRVRVPVEHPHQDEPEMQFYVGVHASETADVTLRLELGESARTLDINEAVQDELRYEALELYFSDWKRTLYRIGTEQHLGRSIVVHVLPVDTDCAGVPCESEACCSGQNPFAHFDVLVQADRQPSDENPADFIEALSVNGFPNYDCREYAHCQAGASNFQCESACVDGECCATLAQYRVELDGAQASTWFVAVQGHGRLGSGVGALLRRTDKYKIVVTVLERIDGELKETFSNPLGPAGVQTEEVREGRDYDFRSGGLSDGPEVRSLQLGQEVRGHIKYAEWALYNVVAMVGGLLEVSLTQDAGLFGLRVLAQRGGLPSIRSFSNYLVSPGEETQCTPDTDDGAESCKVCTQRGTRPCVCPDSDTEGCSPMSANVMTSSASTDPLRGANAVVRVPVSAGDSVFVGVYAESPVFSPYNYGIMAAMEDFGSGFVPCTNLPTFGTYDRALQTGEVDLTTSPVIPDDADVTVVLNVSTSMQFGECFYSESDGSACELRDANNLTWSTWTGRGIREGRPAECSGCYMEGDVEYPGGELELWKRQFSTAAISVTQTRCFYQGAWLDVTTVLSSSLPPYYIIEADPLDPRIATCQTQPMQITVPVVRDVLFSNLTAASEQECCDRCAQEPACTFWSFYAQAECWECAGQNVSDSDVRVGPEIQEGDRINYLSGYRYPSGEERVVWTNQTGFVLENGPSCRVRSVPCCVLRNHTEIEKRAVAEARVGVVSGSFAQCRVAINGRVRMFVTQDLNCNTSTSDAVELLARELTQASEGASEAVRRDARQTWDLPGVGVNTSVCVAWWNGQQLRDGVEVVAGDDSTWTCVAWSTRAIRLAVPDENGDELCLGLVGTQPEVMRCQGKVYLALNFTGDGVDVYRGVNESYAAFARKEWEVAGGVLRLYGTDVCISNGHALAAERCAADGASNSEGQQQQRWSVGLVDADAGVGTLIAGGGFCLGALPDCPKWEGLWVQGCSLVTPARAVLQACQDEPSSIVSVTLLAGYSERRSGQPLLALTQGLIPSAFSVTINAEQAPPSLAPDRTVHLQIAPGSASSFRFAPAPLSGQHKLVVQQRVPATHALSVTVLDGLCSSSNVIASSTFPDDGTLVIVEEWQRSGLPWCVTIAVAASSTRRLLQDQGARVEVWARVRTAGRSATLDFLPAPWFAAGSSELVGEDVRICGRLRARVEEEAVECEVSADGAWAAWTPMWLLGEAEVKVDAVGGCEVVVYAQPGGLPGNSVWNETVFENATGGSNITGETAALFRVNVSMLSRGVRSGPWARMHRLRLQGAGEDWWIGVLMQGVEGGWCADGHSSTVKLSALLVGDGDARVKQELPLGQTVITSTSTYLSFTVEAGWVYLLEVSATGAGGDVFASPTEEWPSRSQLPEGTYLSEKVLGNAPIIITPDDAGFALGLWHVGVHTLGATNLTLLLHRTVVPQTLPLGRQFALTPATFPAASTRVFRFSYASAFSPSLAVRLRQTDARPAAECPVVVLARFSVPPSTARFDAAGVVFGGGAVLIPPAHTVGAPGSQWLVVALSRCAPGALGSGTACRVLEACSTCPSVGCNATSCPAVAVQAGCCAAVNASSSSALMPPGAECSFQFSVADQEP